MAAALADEFRIDAKLIKGDSGIFDVVVDGERIYSKGETGRFPRNEEIVTALRTRQG